MAELKKKIAARAKRTPAPRAAKSISPAERIRDLAWAGQHDRAIELATTALTVQDLSNGTRLDLFDLRAESFVAQGDLVRAAADATAMLDLAERAKSAAFKAQAQNRLALVQIRKGEWEVAMVTAVAALKAARRSKQVKLEAMSLFRLAEAQFRAGLDERAVHSASEAARLFQALGQPIGQGRALWAIGAAHGNLNRVAEGNRATNEALALGRSCGDMHGIGNALNLLTFSEADFGNQLKLLAQAHAAFEAAGYVERQGVAMYNLGLAYRDLGLYRRARRLYIKALEIYRRTGASRSLGITMLELAAAEIEMGHLGAARGYLADAAAMAVGVAQDPRFHVAASQICGRLAVREGDVPTALRHYKDAVKLLRRTGPVAFEINALSSLARAHLSVGNPGAALTATRRATRVHRAHGLTALTDLNPRLVWWRHSQALHANGQTKDAREALEMAYQFMLKGIASLSDEGLRRNYLNKIDTHREIVTAWIKDARRRRLSRDRLTAHLAGEANLREPFERLVDTGLRLNELRSTAELHEFLIDEATELTGAERVLLLLETADGPQLAGSLVPRGEDAQALLRVITPALAGVRRTRAVRLAYGPDGADELEQRSSIIAPLIAQRQLLGYVYIDIDGAYGRFRESDRDLIGMLASQAAVALDNAQWSQGLEQKVAQRTEELQASKNLSEQRASELAVINSIQEGMAAELDFQAIVNLVGDKLREVFQTGDMGIRWVDPKTNLAHYLYEFEHGVRREYPPMPPQPGGTFSKMVTTRQPLVIRTVAEGEALRLTTLPGADPSLSSVYAPIIGRDRVIGQIALYSYERENAYGESDVRLLTTIAASMGVALENARLFDETQSLLKETEQRNAELAVINSIQEGMAAELDFQAIIDLVGDKLREVFCTRDMGIRWHDPNANLVHFLYEYEHDVRLSQPPTPPTAPFLELVRTRQPFVVNNRSEYEALGFTTIPGTDQSHSSVAVPDPGQRPRSGLGRHRELRARKRLRRSRSTAAEHGGGEHGHGARKRTPVRRDAAPAEGNRGAQRRARGDQQHPAGRGCGTQLPCHRGPRRRQAARGVPDRRHGHHLARRGGGRHPLPLLLRARRAACESDGAQRS